MASTKEIQGRIKSVSNTKKVTKAMEMVAAAKMRKAIETVLKTRTYAGLSWDIILRLSLALSGEHALLGGQDVKGESKKVGVILFTSNRGLCGGFNSGIINKLHKSLKGVTSAKDVELILIGKKGISAHVHHKYNVAAEYDKPDIASGIGDVVSIAKMVIDEFLSGKYSKVVVVYTDFVNAAKQVPRIKQLLPVDVENTDDLLGSVGGDVDDGDVVVGDLREYVFEPSAAEVLDEMVPRLIEVQIFQALLESNASEHSARMSAMHQATDAATDMIKELTLTYNKARQASITAEIAEIGAGVNAMN